MDNKKIKTLEIPERLYMSLLEISKEMQTQDGRATAEPRLYVITEIKEVPANEGCGRYKFVDEEGDELTRESLMEDPDTQDDFQFHFGYPIEDSNDYDFESYLTDIKEYTKYWYTEKRVIVSEWGPGFFFTEKAAKEFMACNGNRYRNVMDYVIYAGGNPEIALIYNFLKGLNKAALQQPTRTEEK